MKKTDRSQLYFHMPDYDNKYDFEQEIWEYWDRQGFDHWVDVKNEATSLWNEIFPWDDEVEKDSPIDDFLGSVGLAGFYAAIKVVSKIYDISESDLMEKVDAQWDSKQGGADGDIAKRTEGDLKR